MDKGKFYSGLFVMFGLIVLGSMMPRAVDRFRSFDRTVNVKGLCEKEVKADKVIWPVVYRVMANDIQSVYDQTDGNNAAIIAFLKSGGIVHLKTDSRYLHEYSRAMAEQNDLKILACGTDIYGADREGLYASELSSVSGRAAVDALFEVQTFYESQYLAQGFPITYLAFVADHEGAFVSPEWDEDAWKDENHHFVIPSGLPVASKFYPEG